MVTGGGAVWSHGCPGGGVFQVEETLIRGNGLARLESCHQCCCFPRNYLHLIVLSDGLRARHPSLTLVSRMSNKINEISFKNSKNISGIFSGFWLWKIIISVRKIPIFLCYPLFNT